EKFDDAAVHARMKAQSALVWAECRIELDAKATIDLNLPLIVDPRYTEEYLTLGFANPLDQGAVRIVGIFNNDRSEAVEHLAHSLMKFFFAWIAAQNGCKNQFEFFVEMAQD